MDPRKRFSSQIEHLSVKEKVRKLLSRDNNACFIVITCKEPTLGGKMQVEMTYEGDSNLASYLLDNAQDFLVSNE